MLKVSHEFCHKIFAGISRNHPCGYLPRGKPCWLMQWGLLLSKHAALAGSVACFVHLPLPKHLLRQGMSPTQSQLCLPSSCSERLCFFLLQSSALCHSPSELSSVLTKQLSFLSAFDNRRSHQDNLPSERKKGENQNRHVTIAIDDDDHLQISKLKWSRLRFKMLGFTESQTDGDVSPPIAYFGPPECVGFSQSQPLFISHMNLFSFS